MRGERWEICSSDFGLWNRALFEACQSSKYDDELILAKAAAIVKRQMFAVDETLDGDLSRERQRVSPNVLWQLVRLIAGGPIRESVASPTTARIAITLDFFYKQLVYKQLYSNL